MTETIHPVDKVLPLPRLATLGLQHVLVMYAGAVAVPLIIGRVLQFTPEQLAFLISADLFACGVATILQSGGVTKLFGVRLPVMMGVTFAAVGPMISMGLDNPGVHGARMIFGAIIGAGIVAMIIAPFVSRMLRFFPPVVTGSIILIIGVTLMRVGIEWIFGLPVGPTAPKIVAPEHAAWLKEVAALASQPGSAVPAAPPGFAAAATAPNPAYADFPDMSVSAFVLVVIMLISRYAKGFVANIAVLLGMIAGSIVAAAAGMMHFGKVAEAGWFELVMPFRFGMPIFDPILILTMVIVMIVVMIESTGMFLALGEMTDRKITQPMLSAGLRTDGLGTLIGGIFNTFPYTSFSQNVGLVGVTGVRSRYVCVAGGVILILLGLIPKMGALVAAIPTSVLGGAGLVMFGMVAATGVRILSAVDFRENRYNLYIVAVSVGLGMIPVLAPQFDMWMPRAIHPLVDSGILLASVGAVVLNAFFNGTRLDTPATQEAAMAAGSGSH